MSKNYLTRNSKTQNYYTWTFPELRYLDMLQEGTSNLTASPVSWLKLGCFLISKITRLSKHKRHCRLLQPSKSAVAEHAITEDHSIDFDKSIVLANEQRYWPQKMKEALLIRKHPNFNQQDWLASFPGLPRFFVLRFVFSVIHGTGRAAKNGKGPGTLITWMTFGGHEVDVWGEGPHSNKALDFIIERSNDSQDPRCSRHQQYLSSPGNKLILRFIAHKIVVGHRPPYVQFASTKHHSRDKCSQAFPIFRRSSASVYYTERKSKNKKRGRPGNKAKDWQWDLESLPATYLDIMHQWSHSLLYTQLLCTLSIYTTSCTCLTIEVCTLFPLYSTRTCRTW